ncbi:dispersed gene family protein 1 (DGF-1), putative, partial [Trypanosoma cruzi marinkellei]
MCASRRLCLLTRHYRRHRHHHPRRHRRRLVSASATWCTPRLRRQWAADC